MSHNRFEILSVMKKLIFAFSLVVSTAFMFSCQEEELTPNEDAAKLQQAGIDLLNSSGNNGGNTGGSGGSGGGDPVDEYFSADVDGATITGSDPFFQSALGIDQINSSSNSINDLFQINIFGALEVGTIDNPTINYIKTQTNTFEAFNGQLELEAVTPELIQGTFYCDVANSLSGDTLVVTNGRFRVGR